MTRILSRMLAQIGAGSNSSSVSLPVAQVAPVVAVEAFDLDAIGENGWSAREMIERAG